MFQGFKKIHWTEHSQIKMKQYGLSKSKLSGILRKPERREKAIVPGLVAVMRTNKKFVNKTVSIAKAFRRAVAPGEIWVMYKDTTKQGEKIRKIISAWRYPGVTKPGEEIPIPEDIKRDIMCGIIN